MPFTQRSSLSESFSRPRWTCRSTAVAVNDFVMLAMRTWSFSAIGFFVARLLTP